VTGETAKPFLSCIVYFILMPINWIEPAVLSSWPWALAIAAGLAAIPLWLHWRRRARVRVAPWAAVLLLKRAVRPAARRILWANRLLLATRLAVAATLLTALLAVQPWARPLFALLVPDKLLQWQEETSSVHRIIVLDATLSMNAEEFAAGGPSLFEAAREELIREIHRTGRAGDGYSLILLEQKPRLHFVEPTQDVDAFLRALRQQMPTHIGGDVNGLLQQLANLVEKSSSGYARREVHVLSDQQAATWAPASEAQRRAWQGLWKRIADRAQVHVAQFGRERPFNLRVASVAVDRFPCLTRQPVTITAEVEAYGTSVPTEVQVSLLTGMLTATSTAGWELRGQQAVQLKAATNGTKPNTGPVGASRAVARAQVVFTHVFEHPGAFALQVRLQSGDGLPADDSATRCIRVLDELPVLFIEGSPEAPLPHRDAYCLRLALDSQRWRIRERVMTVEELAAEKDARNGSIEEAACVFVCNVRRIPPREAERLARLVERGGGVIFILGDKVSAAEYNQHLYAGGRGLLPVEILPPTEQLPHQPGFRFAFDHLGYTHPFVQAFQHEPDAGLLSARFDRYVRVRAPAGSAAQIILQFMPETGLPAPRDPALVVAKRAQGSVFVLTTPAARSWSSWPHNTSFLPLMHKIFQEALRPLHDFPVVQAGDAVEHELRGAQETATVVTPHGMRTSLLPQAGGRNIVQFTNTWWNGIYRLLPDGEGQSQEGGRLFTVQLDAVEAEPELQSPEAVRALFGDVPFSLRFTCRFGENVLDVSPAYLPQLLIVLLLAFLIAEGLLGQVVLRGRKAASADERPEARRLWHELGMLCLAGWMAALIGVAVHAWCTGELLAFLPSDWRTSQETTLGLDRGEKLWRFSGRVDVWLVAGVGLGLAGMAVAVRLVLDNQTVLDNRQRLLLAAWRGLTVLAVVTFLLPVWGVTLRGLGRPAVTVVFDDSHSMQAEQELEGVVLTRFQAARVCFEKQLLPELVQKRGLRVRLYLMGQELQFHGEFGPAETNRLAAALDKLQAKQPSSALGRHLRSLLDTEHTLAIVALTDGIVTEGERLRHVGHAARSRGVPLYFAAAGATRREPVLRLLDLRASDWTLLGDNLVFEAVLRAEGLGPADAPLAVKVRLVERNGGPASDVTLALSHATPTVPVRLTFRAHREGEMHFRMEATCEGARVVQPAIDKSVLVLPPSLRVLYLEGSPRYEYRSLRQLMETHRGPQVDQRAFQLDVRLQDPEGEEGSGQPLPDGTQLRAFDLVILGDVNMSRYPPAWLESLRDYVKQGGGLLVLAGPEHFGSLLDSPLAEILPIERIGSAGVPATAEDAPFLPTFVRGTRWHGMAFPSTGSSPGWPAEEQTWRASGYRARVEAEPLAWEGRPDPIRQDMRSMPPAPVLVTWLAGKGRCLFAAFEETWRWRTLEGEQGYERYWLQTLRYVARVRQGPVALSLEQAGPFRRGDGVRVLVRFPPELSGTAEHLVAFQRRAAERTWPAELRTLQRVGEEPGLFDCILNELEAGEYTVWLASPSQWPRPEAGFAVLDYPREADPDRPHPDADEMEAAARLSGGRHTSFAAAHLLLADLPPARPFPLRAARHVRLWDHPFVFGLVMVLLGGEWLVRRRFGVL